MKMFEKMTFGLVFVKEKQGVTAVLGQMSLSMLKKDCRELSLIDCQNFY